MDSYFSGKMGKYRYLTPHQKKKNSLTAEVSVHPESTFVCCPSWDKICGPKCSGVFFPISQAEKNVISFWDDRPFTVSKKQDWTASYRSPLHIWTCTAPDP